MLLFRPFSGQSCSCASALCDCFGDRGFDSRRLPPQTERFPGSKDRVAISKTRLLPPGFLSHPFAPRFPHPPEKTLGPIAPFAGKLSSFDVAAKHEAEIYPDTGCGSRRLCAVRICLP